MPPEIRIKFNDEYRLDKEVVIRNVYQAANANTYLATFSKFTTNIRETKYAQELLKRGLLEFVETNIKSYSQYHTYKCHFVGSIA